MSSGVSKFHAEFIVFVMLFSWGFAQRMGVSSEGALGDATIKGRAGASDIVIKTSSRVAGAIGSLSWNGKEFIDRLDHGRELQSACSFDAGAPGEFWPEAYNPTEAGSRDDGAGDRSTSRLLRIKARGDSLETQTQAAFWLAPGEESSGRKARNDRKLSNHRISKRVKIGLPNLPHAIRYDTTFLVPGDEKHRIAQFEALTGYMPAEFERFWTFDPKSGTLETIGDGPGEQALPLIFSTANGSHAMGIYWPESPTRGTTRASYGRFRFEQEHVVKWNCVFRCQVPKGVPPGEYTFRMIVAVGTLDDVASTLRTLTARKRE